MQYNNLIQVKDLAVSFGKNEVLHHLNFEVKIGEILGIVGESGSGKSLTSLAIMGLLPKKAKTSGKINFSTKIGIQDLLHDNISGIRGKEIGMIFQEPMTSLNPSMTCGNQIVESILLHQKMSKQNAKQKVLNLMEKVKLPNPERIYNAYPHELSGGQKQRILIAIAISSKPKLLIADEPTTALDVTVQKSILSLLKELNQSMGMSIIFISHDLGVIAEISDRVLVMYKGDIIETGNTKTIFYHPKGNYTKGLMACKPPLNQRLKILPTVSDFIKEKDFIPQPETRDERIFQHTSIYQNQPILKIKNLSKYFPLSDGIFKKDKTIKAVDDINFDLYKGETLGLVGESGSGKTTLSRTLLLLEKPTKGEIWYKGTDLSTISGTALRNIRKDIQIIFQDPYASLNPRYKIKDILTEPMKIHNVGQNSKDRLKKAIEILEKVNMPKAALEKYPHEFSGGQRQRIGIARAIALNPRIIICDESVSALDVSVQATVLNLLNELKRDLDLTYLFISHDLSVVKHMSDRLIILQKGEIVETGETDFVYQNPKTDYTQNLIDAIPKY